MIGVSNHLQNAKYVGSMKPFSGSVIGSQRAKIAVPGATFKASSQRRAKA